MIIYVIVTTKIQQQALLNQVSLRIADLFLNQIYLLLN